MDYRRVRGNYTCPHCLGPKDLGLLLCWPCHHRETMDHKGRYSDETELEIVAMEDFLRSQEFDEARS